MERERALELAQRLLVRDPEEVRRHDPLRGIAHEVVQRGADLHGVLWMAPGRIEEAVHARVVDRDLLRGELLAQVGEPVIGRDPEAMAAGLGEVDRDSEPIERAALLAEQLLEDALLGAEERVRHALLRLEARPHDVEDAWSEAARSLEFVERDDDALARPRRERARQIERAVEEALCVGLARELKSQLDV